MWTDIDSLIAIQRMLKSNSMCLLDYVRIKTQIQKISDAG